MRHVLAVIALLALGSTARADALGDALPKITYALAIKDGKLAGPGADVLRPAIDAAQFVMLGEDHGISQIPQLAAALCAELAPHGFHRLALEVGASIAPELTAIARSPDPAARARAFDRANPETVAFYNWREEVAFLQACAKATGATPLEIWGLDQELMGAPAYVLPKILATRPGPLGRAAIEQLVRDNAADHAVAAKTGDFGALFLLKATQASLDAARDALAKDGSPEAQALFGALLTSRTIYLGQGGPTPYLSNRQRARLMKEQFLDDLTVAARTDQAFPKVLIKLGAYHLYRGLNPLHSSEVGNLIAEAAEGHKVDAVNVLVLGVKGKQLTVTGVGKPFAAAALDLAADPDSPFRFLAPLFAAQRPGGLTLFELRALRPTFRALGTIDPELERLIFAYDFVVLIAAPIASHPL